MAEAPSRRLGPGGRRAKGGLAVLTNESGKRRGRLTRDWTRSRHWESATHIRAPLCDARTPILFLPTLRRPAVSVHLRRDTKTRSQENKDFLPKELRSVS